MFDFILLDFSRLKNYKGNQQIFFWNFEKSWKSKKL